MDFSLIPLQMLPGLVTVDSPYAAKGRYIAGSNVRFWKSYPERLGGWASMTAQSLGGAARGVHAWTGLDGARYLAWGTATKLWLMKDGTLYDITPVGMIAGLDDTQANALVAGAWGSLGWGALGWGGGNAFITSKAQVRTWRLSNWGQDLVAAYRGGPLYLWSAAGGAGAPAAQVVNAPTVISDFYVSETNRYLVALGATGGAVAGGGDAMTIAWCDRENITNWTPAVANTAGDKRMEIGSQVLTSVDARGGRLVFTDAAIYEVRYIGPPFIHSVTKVSEGYDVPIGPNAVVSRDGVAFWMGETGISSYAGAVKPIACDVHNEVYDNIRQIQAFKVCAGLNRKFGEITFFYPDARDGSENSRHFSLNADGWSLGTLARTSWIDENVSTNNPVGTDAAGSIYLHEVVGADGDGSAIPWSLETSEIELGTGDKLMRVRKLIPNYKRMTGSQTVTVASRAYPEDAERSHAPRIITPGMGKVSVRARGRSIRLRLESSVTGNDFRLGLWRAAVKPDGGRA